MAARTEPGHLEGDLIYGAYNRSAVATFVERVSRHTTLVALPNGYRADLVSDALTNSLSEVPEPMRKTLTWDQGREMRKWKQIEQATRTPIYFCDIHSPWQKPTVENNNGILRRWLPKGTRPRRLHPNRPEQDRRPDQPDATPNPRVENRPTGLR